MDNEKARAALRRLISERRETYAALSRLLGRNAAYVQQYVTRGSPSRLQDRDRAVLAQYFGVPEEQLGGRPSTAVDASTVMVPRLAVQASAGAGSMVDGEFAIGAYRFDKAWLHEVSEAKADQLSIIKVAGDSMAPTLSDGDEVLVDQSPSGKSLRDGIYVLRRDDTLMVKRLALGPASGTVTVASDNPAYPTWPDCALDSVIILGRVVWIGRKLR